MISRRLPSRIHHAAGDRWVVWRSAETILQGVLCFGVSHDEGVERVLEVFLVEQDLLFGRVEALESRINNPTQ